jgi:hypothetical protein
VSAVGIDKYLNDIRTKIYASTPLCKLLYHDTDNPLAGANLSPNNSIIYTDKENKKLFFTPFTLDNADVTKSTLTIFVDNFRLDKKNTYFKSMNIHFVIAVNNRIWELDDNSGELKLRPNLIIYYLNEIFNRQRTVGLGVNNFDRARIFYPNPYFSAYEYVLEAVDFTLNTK